MNQNAARPDWTTECWLLDTVLKWAKIIGWLKTGKSLPIICVSIKAFAFYSDEKLFWVVKQLVLTPA